MIARQLEEAWIANRINVVSDLPYEEICRFPSRLQSNMFFTYDGINEPELLKNFRYITDQYCTGQIGFDEARHLLRQCVVAAGKDDGTDSLTNLASTARLNLILDQNAKMARAVGQYEAMHRPANLQMFPYVIYCASAGCKDPRGDHQKYDGMVIDKRDPWLKTHWPPQGIGCNCDLSNCTAKKAASLGVKPLSRRREAASAFVFDPSAALIRTSTGMRLYSPKELQGFLDKELRRRTRNRIFRIILFAILMKKTPSN